MGWPRPGRRRRLGSTMLSATDGRRHLQAERCGRRRPRRKSARSGPKASSALKRLHDAIQDLAMPLPRSSLQELEDRLLAQCEGDWIGVPMAMAVLGSWFDREVSRAELIEALGRLIDKGLVVSRGFLPSSVVGATANGRSQVGVEFMATQTGIDYLATTRG